MLPSTVVITWFPNMTVLLCVSTMKYVYVYFVWSLWAGDRPETGRDALEPKLHHDSALLLVTNPLKLLFLGTAKQLKGWHTPHIQTGSPRSHAAVTIHKSRYLGFTAKHRDVQCACPGWLHSIPAGSISSWHALNLVVLCVLALEKADREK